MRTLSITNAEYIEGYSVQLSFSDGTVQMVDFGPFLLNHPHPQHDKYRRITKFKRFHLDRGNIVWGKDWDLIFPMSQLHQECIAPAVY